MVKAKKTVFYIMLSLALAAFAVTIILLFVPEPKPLTVTEKFYITEDCELHGKIKNDSGKEITVKSIYISVHVKSPAAGSEFDSKYTLFDGYGKQLTLQPNEEHEINEQLSHLDGDRIKITLITAYVDNHAGFNLYGKIVNDGTFSIVAAFVGFAGFLFLVMAISNLVGNIIIAKRANRIIDDISQRFDGAIYAAGYLGNKKRDRAENIKTAAGIIGGAVMQLATGTGIYSVGESRRRRDFVICDESIYEVNGKAMNYENITPLVQFRFKNAEISEKRNGVAMTGTDGTSYFTFTVSDDKKKALAEKLNNIFNRN
ncbi:MAG: hypothetical protein K2N22_02545 [Clostridia bacterium]|nr:hypothetical protein [Clostridia bacterium]